MDQVNHSARNQGRLSAKLTLDEVANTASGAGAVAALIRILGAEKVARLFGLDATEGEAWDAALRDYAEAFTETLREAAR